MAECYCNICMCGAQAGYPHKWDCPYPYYGSSERCMADWQERRNKIRQATSIEETSQRPTLRKESSPRERRLP